MTSPTDVSPGWEDEVVDGLATSAFARITFNGPLADSSEGPYVLFLDINPDDDGFRWSVSCEVEEGAPFNEGEIKWGSATDLEQAKRDSWSEVCRFLTSLGYTDDEITRSISQPAGSLILDLDDDYDDEE